MAILMKDKIYIIIIFILALLLSFRQCNPRIETKIEEKLIYDTITITEYLPAPEADTVFVDKNIYKRIIITKEIPAHIDTSAIVKQFLETKVYSRTLKNDSIAYAFIKDTICGNSLIGSQFIYKHKAPTVIEHTKTVFKPRREVLLGFSTNVSSEPDLFVSGLYITRYGGAYSLGYSPFTKSINGSVYFRLFK